MFKRAFKVLMMSLLLCQSFSVLANARILLLGDSLSASYGMKQNQGWVYLLNQQLKTNNAPYQIINASISGETTAGGLSRLPGILSKEEVDYLLIELGGNDGLRGFPPKLIKNNLLQIIDLAKQKNISVFLMNVKIPPNYGPRYNKMFGQVFIDVAEQTNVPLLPFFLKTIAVHPELMQNDGIHPSVEAQPKIVEVMANQLADIITTKASN
ncbi:arylesterase [Thalassotalea euphylliae]|uniref:Arylesterase n=1 Tax=Thalassotalea euphylliae TaxID=1655234 RepID=A0A3E0TYT9_9GAMM|nr:arylesterase [Thalassotalea euphylliae]REL29788.1 arylesterase [Thalassotalea euphylliae]